MDKKLILFNIICIVLILSAYRYYNYNNIECMENTGILYSQQIGNISCCDGCLNINVSEFECSYGCGCDWVEHTLYFADENKLLNISNGEEVLINWCHSEKYPKKVVRGVRLK